MKTITKALVKGIYYTAKFAGHIGAVVKEGAVDGYTEALNEIKVEECPWDEKSKVVATETVEPAVETPY
tara:strand:+ start:47 stop:253 length:207 start_codon:yes stop_codon:yes gene_type:complete